LKAAIAKAFTESPTKDKAAFDRLSDGQKQGFHPATTKDWDATVDLIKFVDNLRRKRHPERGRDKISRVCTTRLFPSGFYQSRKPQ